MLSVLASVVVGQAAVAPALIPLPSQMTVQEGHFALKPDTRIVAAAAVWGVAGQIQNSLSAATGYPFDVVRRGGANAIHVTLDRKLPQLGKEGYRLHVRPDRIDIRAYEPAGAFYGIQTLRQLLPAAAFRKAPVQGGPWDVPCVTIEDVPRFGWRGALIDSSRHFLPKDGILKFLDQIAAHKLNVLHWHLTDDDGWRIEIRKYPKLTEVGAFRPETRADYDPPKLKTGPRGGYYTQDDVREVVAYAAARHITVVPEIELPGHAAAAVTSYPEVGTPRSNVFNAELSTLQFLKDVFDEVLELFPSKFIHVGGDEVDKGPWRRDARTQEIMKERGLKNEDELQSWFIHQMDEYLASKGRRLIGWDEILEGGLAPGATVMSWRGMEGGIAAAKAGHDVVMAPTTYTYIDYYQGDPSLEPLSIGGFLPLSKTYSMEPIPAELTAEEGNHILGVQGQLWGEFIPNIGHLEYMAWPRLAAIAEIGWSPKVERDLPGLEARLTEHFKRLQAMDVRYRPLAVADPNRVGEWKSGEVSQTFGPKEWDVTEKVKANGVYVVRFQYSHGESRLDIKRVEFVVDGAVSVSDVHDGSTGGVDSRNEYRLNLTTWRPGAKVVIRAEVAADGSPDSNGVIRLVKQ